MSQNGASLACCLIFQIKCLAGYPYQCDLTVLGFNSAVALGNCLSHSVCLSVSATRCDCIA